MFTPAVEAAGLVYARIPAIVGSASLETEPKERAMARMAERIARESETLPYRWGYFQGAVLFPWSLLLLLGVALELQKPHHEPWYLTGIALVMGLIGLPLGYGLLRKRKFAFVLVYVMFGLTILSVATEIPVVMRHFSAPGDKGTAFFEAELLVVGFLSLLYYRRRRTQFR